MSVRQCEWCGRWVTNDTESTPTRSGPLLLCDDCRPHAAAGPDRNAVALTTDEPGDDEPWNRLILTPPAGSSGLEATTAPR